MELLDLNDDILTDICSHLFGRNIRNLSLTCKRLHDLAVVYIASILRVCDVAELKPLCQYFLDRDQSSASQVHSIVLLWGPRRVKSSMKVTTGEPDDRGINPAAPEVMNLVLSLLSGTRNLKRLSFAFLDEFLHHDKDCKLAAILRGLLRLRWAEIGSVTAPVLKFIGSTGWNLSTLSLFYDSTTHINLKHRDYGTIRMLLTALSNFPNLHTLCIVNFRVLASYRDLQEGFPYLYPSVRRLFILGASKETLDFVDLFPNITLLEYSVICMNTIYRVIQEPLSERLAPSPATVDWPPLRFLMLSSIAALRYAKNRLCTVENLQVGDRIIVDMYGKDTPDVSTLLEGLRKASPVGLQLWLVVDAEPMRFWAQVPAIAPRLRYLELKLSTTEVKEDCACWLDNLPDALRGLSLLGLRLYFPLLPYVVRSQRASSCKDPVEKQMQEAREEERYKAEIALSDRMYDHRIAITPRLAIQLAGVMPTLKLIGILDEGPNLYFDPPNRPEWEEDRDEYISDSDIQEWDFPDGRVDDDVYFEKRDDYAHVGEWHLESPLKSRWWRVRGVDVDSGVQHAQLRALTPAETRCAQRIRRDRTDLTWLEDIENIIPFAP